MKTFATAFKHCELSYPNNCRCRLLYNSRINSIRFDGRINSFLIQNSKIQFTQLS